MYRFKARPVREIDADGTATLVGLEWTEPREWVLDPAEGAMRLIFVGLMLTLFVAFANPGNMGVLLVAAMLALAFAAAWITGRFFGAKTRSLYFHADGRIECPNGLPVYFWHRWLVARVDRFLGIQVHEVPKSETRKSIPSYEVRIYTHDGDIAVLSDGLQHWEAHKIVVMLTAAYREIMELRAGIGRKAVHGTVRGHPVDVMVD